MIGIIQKIFRKTPITSKMVILTTIVGVTAWAVLDHIFTNEVKNTFLVQLHENLKNQSQEARADFNNYVRAHSQLVKLVAGQKQMINYLEQSGWFSEPYDAVIYHNTYPKWFVSNSTLRVLASPSFVVLFDHEKNAREIYHRPRDSFPNALLSPSEIFLEKSLHQGYLTSIENYPYLLSSELIYNSSGRRAILMHASPVDDEFLTFSQYNSPKRLIALMSSDTDSILTSNNLSLLHSGMKLNSLKDHYLITGDEFYEYGDAEVIINLVSFMSKVKAQEMTDKFVLRQRMQWATIAFIFVMLSVFIMFLITRRIGKLRKNIADFSQQALGGRGVQSSSGDELSHLENRFQLLIKEVESSQKIIQKTAEERVLKKTELEMKERLYRLLRSVTDAMGIGVLSKHNNGLHAANEQMTYFQELCGSLEVFETKSIQEEEKTVIDIQGNNRVFMLSSPILSTREEVILVREITEKKNLTDQLRQLQKMNAVGQLAGGIAHDFNNILYAINGYADILKKELKDSALKDFVEEILYSSKRGTSLIKNLLAFSRKQPINPKPVDLNKTVKNVKNILSRLIGEDIELNTILLDKSAVIHADLVQIEHVLMNLATNARDAMPDGGILTIRIEQANVEEGFLKGNGSNVSGKYYRLSVLDAGIGMNDQTKKKIFEPFFTTKDVGKGSGLGLSMVYGIIMQHKGHIEVYSEPDAGTMFEIYFPALHVKAEEYVKEAGESLSILGGTETLLLVEDDPTVRKLTKSTLTKFGYCVIEASDGDNAVREFIGNKDKIDLLLTDVIMPKKNGYQVYTELKALKPDIKTLFISGYPADHIERKGVSEDSIHFMIKPFSMDVLLNKIREVLDTKN